MVASMECSSGSSPATISGAGRRTSSRIRRQVCYNDNAVRKAGSSPRKKKASHKRKKSISEDSGGDEEAVEKDIGVGVDAASLGTENFEGGELVSLGLQVEVVNKLHTGAGAEKSATLKVKETLRSFNKHYLHLIQEEEKRCDSQRKTDKVSKKEMMETSAILYPRKQFGEIPGVEVGHQFFSRAEMVVVGFHSHWLNGIDYMGQNYCNGDFSKYTFPLAVSIVISGQYEDDVDNSEDVVYTGQGGNNLLGDKRQVRDQEMARGNLALKNNMEQGLPVRVVRGHDSKASYVKRVYTYDGLYKVVKYWAEKGLSGFTVYKFGMKRLEGQPELTTNQVQYIRGKAPTSVAEVRGLVCEDISEGQEDISIPATNLVDKEPFPPTGNKSLQVAANVKIPKPTYGCRCKGMCVDPNVCACAKLNGNDFPYVHRDGGRLVEAKAVVFECGPKCGCGPSCINRTSQKGIRYRLEVFRTPKKGWAVRSWDCIPAGAPVCEYTGILKRSDEAESVAESNYIFDIDCLQTMKGLDGRERRFRDVSIPNIDNHDDKISDSIPEFCIDAGSTGNIARFFNHSCEPNLFVQCILSSHHDIKLAKVMLVAADNIPPLQELTYDYGYALDSVHGPDGQIKKMTCYCGASGCRKRLF
ncbi:hypothetical protein V2J09_011479 [Rumex salicifolius]